KPPPKRQLFEFLGQPADHVQNVQVRRSSQKLPATLPSSPIPRIKHPVSLPGKKFSQRLFAGDGGIPSHRMIARCVFPARAEGKNSVTISRLNRVLNILF